MRLSLSVFNSETYKKTSKIAIFIDACQIKVSMANVTPKLLIPLSAVQFLRRQVRGCF